MMSIILAIIFIIVALIAGIVTGFYIANSKLNKNLQIQKENILKEAEVKAEALKQQKILETKERILQLKEEHDKQVQQRNQQILQLENKLKAKDSEL